MNNMQEILVIEQGLHGQREWVPAAMEETKGQSILLTATDVKAIKKEA